MVQAGLGAEPRLLAGLEQRGGGGVPGAAHALPSTQLQDGEEREEGSEGEKGIKKKTRNKETEKRVFVILNPR